MADTNKKDREKFSLAEAIKELIENIKKFLSSAGFSIIAPEVQSAMSDFANNQEILANATNGNIQDIKKCSEAIDDLTYALAGKDGKDDLQDAEIAELKKKLEDSIIGISTAMDKATEEKMAEITKYLEKAKEAGATKVYVSEIDMGGMDALVIHTDSAKAGAEVYGYDGQPIRVGNKEITPEDLAGFTEFALLNAKENSFISPVADAQKILGNIQNWFMEKVSLQAEKDKADREANGEFIEGEYRVVDDKEM